MYLDEYTTAICRDIIVSVSALSTAIIAIVGYNKWRKELHGRTEYEIAMALLKIVYKIRINVIIVRSCMSTDDIISAFKRAPDMEPGLIDLKKGIIAAYEERLQGLENARLEMVKYFVDGEVLWGKQIKDLIIPLLKQVDSLRYWVGIYVQEKDPGNLDKINYLKKPMVDIVIDSDGGNDNPSSPFLKNFNRIVLDLENFLRQKIYPHDHHF
jgi:hypothetical protein